MVKTVRFCSGSDGEVYNNSYESKIAISNRSQLGNLKKIKEYNLLLHKHEFGSQPIQTPLWIMHRP